MSTTSTPAAHTVQPADDQPAGGRPVAVQPADLSVAQCSCRVYEAECALHAAHQSGVDAWITAAGDRLHQALANYLEAVATTETNGSNQ